MYLEFKNEMLTPSINGEIYYQVYDLENWFRRICLTAYMKVFGADWVAHVPRPIFNNFRSKYNKSQELLHLDLQGEDNLIWMATHGELIQLLMLNEISDQVKFLTGFTPATLSQKLDELRHIRNILAHNRAFSKTTLVIVRGIIASLRQGIQIFKIHVLYPSIDGMLIGKLFAEDDNEGSFENDVSRYLIEVWQRNDRAQKSQIYISLYNNIYSLVSLPVDREGIYPSASRLLNAYKSVMEYILAFTLNKTGTEYCILMPSIIPENTIKKVIDIFMPEPHIWMDSEFEKQNPKYICHPKIWFYENQRPSLEEMEYDGTSF